MLEASKFQICTFVILTVLIQKCFVILLLYKSEIYIFYFQWYGESQHGLINYIDTKAKCCNLKKWLVKGLCGRCLFVWGPPYTLYTFFILIHTGKGLRGGPERRLEGQQFTKLGQKYQHMMYLQSINSDKHLPQSPFTGKFFQMTTFRFGFYIVN